MEGKFMLVHAAREVGAKRARKFVFTRSRRWRRMAVVFARFATSLVDCWSFIRGIVSSTGSA